MKNNKGITLIALVITIIVLLILAGVSIAMLTGQNGILSRATEASSETKVEQAEEAVKLAVANFIAINKGMPSDGINAGEFNDSVEEIDSDFIFNATDEGTEGGTEIPIVKVIVKEGEREIGTYYIISSSGVITITDPNT